MPPSLALSAVAAPPPPLAADDPRGQRADLRYAKLAPEQIPLTECLKDTVARVLPCWNEVLAPAIKSGRRVLVHCAANKRVTAFVGLYRVIRQEWDAERAFAPMKTVWEPNAHWAPFIEAMLEKHARKSE